jgi:hypothetical protein
MIPSPAQPQESGIREGETPTEPRVGAAPADLRPHARWPIWKRIAAYILLALLAVLAIWIVDQKVRRIETASLPSTQPSQHFG